MTLNENRTPDEPVLSEKQVEMLGTIFSQGHCSVPDYNITPAMREALSTLSHAGVVTHRITEVTGVWDLTASGQMLLKTQM